MSSSNSGPSSGLGSGLAGTSRRQVYGFTAIELLTVLTIVGIMASFAMPSFGKMMATSRVKGASTNIYLALTKARSEAIKRNANVTISRSASGWQGGWTIFPTATPGTILASQGAVAGVTICGRANPVTGACITAAPASVVYLNSGRIQNNATPSFHVIIAGKSWLQRCVSTSVTGSPTVKSAACS